jgi:UDP-glucose 4-epimerase
LINSGAEPVIIDNLSNSSAVVLGLIENITGKKVPFFNIDLTDAVSVKKFYESHPAINSVIHFAAHKYVGESVAHPLRYYYNNICSLINVLECFKERETRIVFSSSCTVYGEPDALPVTEESEIKKAKSPYGNTKQICEEILKDSVLAHPNIRGTSLRYFNPVGAHSSGRIGEFPLNVPQNLFPYITQTAMGIREKLIVHGNDYKTPDGTCIRDYLHVVDLAKSHIRALERLAQNQDAGMNYTVYNVGRGHGYSVLEVIKAFERVNKVKVNYMIGPRRAGDIEKIWASTKKVEQELGWKAVFSLEEMVYGAWEWEKYFRNSSSSM